MLGASVAQRSAAVGTLPPLGSGPNPQGPPRAPPRTPPGSTLSCTSLCRCLFVEGNRTDGPSCTSAGACGRSLHVSDQ